MKAKLEELYKSHNVVGNCLCGHFESCEYCDSTSSYNRLLEEIREVRHRPCSFAQESTRYVNYGGKDMEFIEPWWWGKENLSMRVGRRIFEGMCACAERGYNDMLATGRTPQESRAVLPNALKTEIIVTADLREWQHIFKLRCAKSAHPDFVRLAVDLRQQFEETGIIEKEESK